MKKLRSKYYEIMDGFIIGTIILIFSAIFLGYI